MAATQGGRSPTGVAAMPRKLECFGLASYKKLRIILAKLLLGPANEQITGRPSRLYRQQKPVPAQAPVISTLNLDDFWPHTAPMGRWGLVALQDDLLDHDARRRLKLWLET